MIDVLLYDLGVNAYAAGIRLAAPFKPKARLFVAGRKGLRALITDKLSNESRPRIWVHCASLGEFEQGRPVIEAIKQRYPGYAIVLTFFSPSGYEVRKNYDGADHVFYLPVDTKSNADWFVEIVKPTIAIFVKYELWYHYLKALSDSKIPTLLISAIFNKGHGFFKWYGGLQRKMLGMFTKILVQDVESEQLLSGIGLRNVQISGDTRFDRVVAAVAQTANLPIAKAFCGNSKILIAGSTWDADEAVLKEALQQIPADWKLILVPHEVHEAHVQRIEKLFVRDFVRWSQWDNKDANKRVLIVDKVGLLLQLYSYGHVAFIGGGFGKAGVHNVLEAAVYGMPCLYGPVYDKFKEAIDLIGHGGGSEVTDADALLKQMLWMDIDTQRQIMGDKAKGYVFGAQGATEKTLEVIEPILTHK